MGKATAEHTIGRRARKRAETRDRLFEAALQLFAKKGFVSTTVEDITEAADVGKGTFFNYFRTKEHILSYFAEQQGATIMRWAHENDEIGASVQERLHALITTASKLPGNNPELVRAAFFAFLADEEVRQEWRKTVAVGRKVIAEYFHAAQLRNEIRSDTPAVLLARTFQQMVFGAVLLWSLHQDAAIISYLESGLGIIWRGMAPEVSARPLSATRTGKERQHGKRS